MSDKPLSILKLTILMLVNWDKISVTKKEKRVKVLKLLSKP